MRTLGTAGRRAGAVALCALALCLPLLAVRCRTARPRAELELPPLPPAEFAALVEKLSEPGGNFPAENLVSNETSYLEVAEALSQISPKGGVYLGVGPDQNFNYIARLRPSWAFILDIRRQNLVQHLLFNALFEEAEDPYHFLCGLLSRPCPERTPDAARSGIEPLLQELDKVQADAATLRRSEAAALRHIETRLGMTLDAQDRSHLAEILQSFFEQQLEIKFRGTSRPSWLKLPNYRELLVERSPSGRFGHYLASQEDYDRVRALERARRVVPVVGDFAGPHALKAIGAELESRGERVVAFYLSNVEFYLFRSGAFERFLQNLSALPLREGESSLLIRACFGFGRPHPMAQAGRISVTLLQPIPRYIAFGSAGRYATDWDACLLDYVTTAH